MQISYCFHNNIFIIDLLLILMKFVFPIIKSASDGILQFINRYSSFPLNDGFRYVLSICFPTNCLQNNVNGFIRFIFTILLSSISIKLMEKLYINPSDIKKYI